MYDGGFESVTCVDYSKVVVDKMVATARSDGPRYLRMDVAAMDTFEDGRFGTVVDNGLLVSLVSDANQDASAERVRRTFAEVDRVLDDAGCYLCVSLAEPRVLDQIVQGLTGTYSLTAHVVEPLQASVHSLFAFVYRRVAATDATDATDAGAGTTRFGFHGVGGKLRHGLAAAQFRAEVVAQQRQHRMRRLLETLRQSFAQVHEVRVDDDSRNSVLFAHRDAPDPSTMVVVEDRAVALMRQCTRPGHVEGARSKHPAFRVRDP
jgi:hypothetical protein